MEPTTEDVYRGLAAWWLRNCKSFSVWFLTQTSVEQSYALLKASPDMPEEVKYGDKKITDILVPDIEVKSLLHNDGKGLILFIAKAVGQVDHSFAEDLHFVKSLQQTDTLPDLASTSSSADCSHLDTPHVDPTDPDENVRHFSDTTAESTRKKVRQQIETNRMVELKVWLALKLRRMTVSSFIMALAEVYEHYSKEKPSPTAHALIRSEMEQRLSLGSSGGGSPRHTNATSSSLDDTDNENVTGFLHGEAPTHVFTKSQK